MEKYLTSTKLISDQWVFKIEYRSYIVSPGIIVNTKKEKNTKTQINYNYYLFLNLSIRKKHLFTRHPLAIVSDSIFFFSYIC